MDWLKIQIIVLYCDINFVSFLVFGILQEKIMKHQRYGEEVQVDGAIGVKFTLPIALVCVLTMCYCTFAKG